MDYQVNVSRLAESDVEDIFCWLFEKSEDLARKWYGAWLSAKRSLEVMPNHCPTAPEARSSLIEIRQLLFGEGSRQYRIVFGVSVAEGSGLGVVTIYRVRSSNQEMLHETEILGVEDYD